jgi:response regulator RpfG family c-di-GMP phosphodiesterase
MPRQSGGEVLAALRDRGYEGRVVMVTAVEPDFDVVEMPFDDYVTKPVDRATVLEVVERQRRLATYDERLDEYVRKRRKLDVLEHRKSRAELEDSDRYDALRVVVESLYEELEAMIEDHDLDPSRRAQRHGYGRLGRHDDREEGD